MSYFHAGGIDKPLLITKEGAESVVPRETWRGQFHAGTSPTTGLVRDCPIGVQTNCLQVPWPGMRTNARHGWAGEQPEIDVWYDGPVDGMRDASGQMYMRNRYYDPATGQFTQTDPIGIAGGLNAYGFAAGDPVSYSDPYGLCPNCGKNEELDWERIGLYPSMDRAARAAMREAYGPSIQTSSSMPYGQEYGGEIQNLGGGVFSYTPPRPGGEAGFSPDPNVDGFGGAYHSHGADSHGTYIDEAFSPQDRRWGDNRQVSVYLVTPSGRMMRYDPDPRRAQNGQVTQLGDLSP